MLAGERDAAVDRAEIVVVLLARRVGPDAEAAHRERRAVPCDRDAVIELGFVLWMDLRAVVHGRADAFFRAHRSELERLVAPDIGAEQHAFAAVEAAVRRIADLLDRKIGHRDAAVDALVLFPEAAL